MSHIMWDFILSADISDSLYSDSGGLMLGFSLGLDTDCGPSVGFLGQFGVEDECVWCTWSSEVPPVPIKHWSIEMLYR